MLQPSATADGSDTRAEVAKLADALDLGSSVERRASSSLALGTIFIHARSIASGLFMYSTIDVSFVMLFSDIKLKN